MNDSDIAKRRLFAEGKTLSIVKNGEVLFETVVPRITGFLDAIEQLGPRLENAAVADRVVGKAMALLFAYARIKDVYAEVLSKKAKTVLEKHGISSECRQLVETILDFRRSSICPFEKIAMDIFDPEQAYETFKALMQSS